MRGTRIATCVGIGVESGHPAWPPHSRKKLIPAPPNLPHTSTHLRTCCAVATNGRCGESGWLRGRPRSCGKRMIWIRIRPRVGWGRRMSPHQYWQRTPCPDGPHRRDFGNMERGQLHVYFFAGRPAPRLASLHVAAATAIQAALPLEQIFSIVRGGRTVTPLCLLARAWPLPYVHRRGTIVPHSSQGGVQFPTGGKGGDAKPASAFGPNVLGVSRSGVIPEPTV